MNLANLNLELKVASLKGMNSAKILEADIDKLNFSSSNVGYYVRNDNLIIDQLNQQGSNQDFEYCVECFYLVSLQNLDQNAIATVGLLAT